MPQYEAERRWRLRSLRWPGFDCCYPCVQPQGRQTKDCEANSFSNCRFLHRDHAVLLHSLLIFALRRHLDAGRWVVMWGRLCGLNQLLCARAFRDPVA